MQTVLARSGKEIPVVNRKRFNPRVETGAMARRSAAQIDHATTAAIASVTNVPAHSAVNFIRQGDVELTAEQAQIIADNCTHEIQKSIRPLDHPNAINHISVLASIMSTPGAWMEETQLRFGLLDGRLWIMNGNHRIRAQAQAGVPIMWNIKIDVYEDETEFRQAFHKFNTNSRGRTENQILGATGFAVSIGVSKQTASAAYNAMPFIISEFRTGKVRDEEEILRSRVVDSRLKRLATFKEEILLFDRALKKPDGRVKRKLLGAGATAIALATLKYQPEIAFEFWSGVAKNDGLKKGDPRHTLVMDLMTRVMSKGLHHQSMYAPAAAWNAWFEGRSLSLIKVLDTPAIRISGTPYKG